MANRTVVIEIATKKQDFPVGTVAGKFLFELLNSDGFRLSHIETDALGASFPNVPEANGYVARVTRNGVAVSKTFDIAATSVVLDVPDVVTVTF